jgi:hypothetical protein
VLQIFCRPSGNQKSVASKRDDSELAEGPQYSL